MEIFMGKVFSLKDEAFKRATLDRDHATTVYVFNMNNPELPEQKPAVKADSTFNPTGKGLVPFGSQIPEDMTLAGAMKRIKPQPKKQK